MHAKASALLESGSLAFLGGLTLQSLNLHDVAMIANAIAVCLTAWGAKRAATGKARKPRVPKTKPTNL
jgi:hypothetical protein